MPSAVGRSLKILEAIARKGEPVSFTELVAITDGGNKATVSRLLKDLIDEGYLIKDATSGLYKLGYRMAVFAAARTLGRKEYLIGRYEYIMHELCKKWDVTVVLMELVQGAFVGIRKVQSQTSAFMQPEGYVNDQVGQPWTQLCFAFAPEMTPPDLPQKLRKGLESVKGQGYAYDDQTLRENFRRIGFPLLDSDGQLIGCLGLGGSILQITDESLDKIIKDCKRRLG